MAQAPDRPIGFPAACESGEVQVMLLGTYHFANPGKDAVRDVEEELAIRPARVMTRLCPGALRDRTGHLVKLLMDNVEVGLKPRALNLWAGWGVHLQKTSG